MGRGLLLSSLCCSYQVTSVFIWPFIWNLFSESSVLQLHQCQHNSLFHLYFTTPFAVNFSKGGIYLKLWKIYAVYIHCLVGYITLYQEHK